MRVAALLLAAALPVAAAPEPGGEAPEVTLQSLLDELIDFDAVARWPSPAYTCRQASSYDRATVAPDKPGWFANNDRSYAPKPVHNTPFCGEPRIDQPMTQGHNTSTRTRNLDGIPFTRSLQFDIELISWKPTTLTYAATTCWYAFPGTTSNVQPQPGEAALPVPTLAEAIAATATPRKPGAVECETMKVLAKSGDFFVGEQDMDPFGGYADSVKPSAAFPLGTFASQDGRFRLRIEVAGANASSKGAKYFFFSITARSRRLCGHP